MSPAIIRRRYHAGTEGDHCCCPGAGGDGGIVAVIDVLVVLVGYRCRADDGSVGSRVVVIVVVMVVGCSLRWGDRCRLSLSCVVLWWRGRRPIIRGLHTYSSAVWGPSRMVTAHQAGSSGCFHS